MNINFSGRSFSELFDHLCNEISNKFNLEIRNISNNIMEMKGKNYSIFFTYDADTSWIYYYNKRNNKTYLISNYININAEDIDRKGLPKEDTISKEIESEYS